MKALITTSTFAEFSDLPLKHLADKNISVKVNLTGKKVTTDYLNEHLPDTDILIAGTEPLTDDLLALAPKLKVISRVGAGLDNIDLEAAKKRNIAIRNVPDGPTDAVAELTLGVMLDLLRKISASDHALRQGLWKKHMGSLLKGKTVGILGYGRIGKKVAQLVTAFGASFLIFDPYVSEPNSVGFEDCLRRSDLITLHLPLTEQTKGIITQTALSYLKPTALFLNLSRGELVDEAALLDALQTQRIAGAGLDTFQNEPYNGPLTKLNNVVLTPHIGSYAKECRIEMELNAVENALNALT